MFSPEDFSFCGSSFRSIGGNNRICYSRLPKTLDEVQGISELFNIQIPSPHVLFGIDANETQLKKKDLKNYRYIHFATHGDRGRKIQNINEPFLLLGQVENKGNDDGFLTISEVMDWKLNADMVTLSACLTGSGKFMSGEGVMNFARAFQQAGAKSVLVSLWEVDSEYSATFMKTFYKAIKDGKSKEEALKIARKEIRKKTSHPFYWAPFVLYGET